MGILQQLSQHWRLYIIHLKLANLWRADASTGGKLKWRNWGFDGKVSTVRHSEEVGTVVSFVRIQIAGHHLNELLAHRIRSTFRGPTTRTGDSE